MVALSIESYEAARAKERQARTQYGGGINVTADSDLGKARDKAAAAVGASPSYVQQAKKVQAEAPQLADEVKAGTKTLTQAVREVKEQKSPRVRRE